ncbi:M20 family metallopeptidase [Bacillus gobiensis]|uniref:M20 family metallopeptidase n=1 Tax=Bacillus gobiensis TaxID=1441095 RepID=UPI003D1970E7
MNIEDIFCLIDEEDAISFLQSMIRINSVNPPGNEHQMAVLIKERIEKAGLTAITDTIDDNRTNLIVRRKGDQRHSNNQKKNLVFSGHFDTVPAGSETWQRDPWSAEIDKNKLYGRGASDMKSGVSAMILALEYIHRSGLQLDGDLSFLGTVGEEVDGLGARKATEAGWIDDASAIVIGEPTNNKVTIAHKGVLWVEVTIRGNSAHAGWPDKGVNAILAMHKLISELEKMELSSHEILGNSTINLGMIHGGTAPNMVADYCKLTIDVRTVPGQDHDKVVLQVKNILSSISDIMKVSYEVRVLNNMLCVGTSKNDDFIKLSSNVLYNYLNEVPELTGANYYTDASVFTIKKKNTPILIFGPGDPALAHQPNEWVDTRKYMEAIRYYIALAVNYLGVSSDGQ